MFEGYELAIKFLMNHPVAILTTIAGLTAGILMGALPGLTGTAGVAILIPLTFILDPTVGIVMLAALYAGSTFGGSITAILFNTPGAPEAACTTLDGYPMARRGEGGKALGAALGSSALGGTFAAIVLALVAPPLANVALAFGPAEYFALAMMGISVIAALEASSIWKGLVAGLLGLLVSTVGIDPLTSYGRFTFGIDSLLQGIEFMPVIIGVFAVAEVLGRAQAKNLGLQHFGEVNVSVELPKIREFLSVKWTIIRSFFLGVFIGILPGVGATTASFVSYSEAVRWSKHPEKFGTGILEGVVAPETANNAASGGAMVPLLALGIPGSATTAVLIGGLMIHGIRPGPLMMFEQKELVYTIFVTLFIANVMMLLFGLWAIRFFAKALEVDYTILAPIIIMLCVVGVFALRNSIFDVMFMFAFAILGYFMRKFDYPVAPLIIGLVLGTIAEVNLRRAMIMNNFDFMPIILRPIAGILLLIAVASIVYGFYGQYVRQRKKSQGTPSASESK